jgi:hypothetical protein
MPLLGFTCYKITYHKCISNVFEYDPEYLHDMTHIQITYDISTSIKHTILVLCIVSLLSVAGLTICIQQEYPYLTGKSHVNLIATRLYKESCRQAQNFTLYHEYSTSTCMISSVQLQGRMVGGGRFIRCERCKTG